MQYQVGSAGGGATSDAEAFAVASSFKAAAPLAAEPDRPSGTRWHEEEDDEEEDEPAEQQNAKPAEAQSPDKAAGGAVPNRETLLELSQRQPRWAAEVHGGMAD